VGLSLLAHGAAAVTAGTIVHRLGSTAVAPAATRLASQVTLTEIELVPAPPPAVAPAEAGEAGTALRPEVPRPATPVRHRSASPAHVPAQASGPATTPAAPVPEVTAAIAIATAPTLNPGPEKEEAAPARFALAVGTIGNVAVVSAPSGARGAAPSTTPASAGGGSTGGDVGSVLPERDVTERARLVSSGPLLYPMAARRAELEADIALELVVGLDGRVVSARVLRPAGYGLDEEAVRAVSAYRFSPARRDGRPVRVRMPWTVQFRLR